MRFGSLDKKHTLWKVDGPVCEAIPEMFIDFARGCRVDLGYRLLRRCLRHAFDSKCESIDNKVAKIISYEGELGLHITTPIPASMKHDVYNGDIVFTKNKVLCARCGCKSGSQKDEKVACVHTLCRAYKLSQLLAEDLAEHMLLQLASMMTSPTTEADTWSQQQLSSMKESIVTLMKASGEETIAKCAAPMKTCYEMLRAYCSGTQRSNEWKRVHTPLKIQYPFFKPSQNAAPFTYSTKITIAHDDDICK